LKSFYNSHIIIIISYKSSDKAVGKSIRYRYTIGLELSIKDKVLLEHFCRAIGLDPNKIFTRQRLKFGKTYQQACIVFDCKPMALALEAFGLKSPKTFKISLPQFNDVLGGPSSRELLLAWLRGYYDGDGNSGSSMIGAASKQLLVKIRHSLNIKNPVRRVKKSFTYIESDGTFHHQNSFYVLSIGTDLLDEIMVLFKSNKLFYLKRKDYRFSFSLEKYDDFKERLEGIGISRDELQEIVYKFPKHEVIEIFGVSSDILGRLLEEWGIKLPPKGYWASIDKDSFLNERS